MAIQVIIKRKIKQGQQAKVLIPLILQMRARAMYQPGYITGETLVNIDQPEECLVISTWQSLEDWNEWIRNPERTKMEHKIETLTGEKTKYRIYSPMTPRTICI